MTSTLAIIPVRGGSKGIPRKNLQRVGGVTLTERAVRTACSASVIDRVVVSTDDEDIAVVARRAGAEVVMRPADLGGDTASSESALLHVLDQLEIQGGYVPDVVVFLQATSPFTQAEDIDAAVRQFVTTGADSLCSVSRFHGFVWRSTSAGSVVGVNHDAAFRSRRQERPEEYLENGAIYVMRTTGLRDSRHRFFGRIEKFEMPAGRSLEIDEPDQLELCNLMAPRIDRAIMGSRIGRSPISAVIFDFDGVFTDNRVIVSQDGRESVLCDRGDGMGLSLLEQRGVLMFVMSKERNPVVGARCTKLGIEYRQAIDAKLPVLLEYLSSKGIDPCNAAFVGNDLNDLECMAAVGCGVAVADAHPKVIQAADVVLAHAGGRGAIRELAERIISNMEGE